MTVRALSLYWPDDFSPLFNNVVDNNQLVGKDPHSAVAHRVINVCVN